MAAVSQITVSFSPSPVPLRWCCPRLEMVSPPLTSSIQPSETMLKDISVGVILDPGKLMGKIKCHLAPEKQPEMKVARAIAPRG